MSVVAVRAEISKGIRDRLKTITDANGYCTNVKEVYFDKIPMGLALRQDKLPAILLIQGVDNVSRTELGGCLIGDWELELQLWHCGNIGDCEMNRFEADVFRAIYANSATAQTNSQYRKIHPKIERMNPDRIIPDLNMMEANRVSIVFFRISYRTQLFDL